MLVLVAFLLSIGIALLLVSLLANKPLVASGAVLVMFLAEALLFVLPGFNVGIYIYPQDVAFVLLLGAAILRQLMRPRWSNAHWIWALFALLSLISFSRGVALFGVKGAGVEFRSYAYFISGTLYFSSFRLTPDQLTRLQRHILVAASILVAIACFRWGVDLLGLNVARPWRAAVSGNRFRVLNAQQAFFLASAFILAVHRKLRRHERTRWQYSTVMLLPTVLLLQHRSAWAGLLVGVVGIFFWMRRERSRLSLILASAVLVGGLVTIISLGSALDETFRAFDDSATSAFSTEGGTFMWRVEGWKALLETQHNSALEYGIGRPFGTGFLRYIRGTRIDVQPHNYYLQTFLRMGMLGVFLLLALYAVLLVRAARTRTVVTGVLADSALFGSLLLMQLAYFVPYAPGYDQTLFLGMAFGALVTGQSRHRSRHLPAESLPRPSDTFAPRSSRLA